MPQARRCSPGALQSRPSCGPNVVRAAAWFSGPKLIDAAQAPCGAGLHADRILFVRRLGFQARGSQVPHMICLAGRRRWAAKLCATRCPCGVPLRILRCRWECPAGANWASVGRSAWVAGATPRDAGQRATLVPLYGPSSVESLGNCARGSLGPECGAQLGARAGPSSEDAWTVPPAACRELFAAAGLPAGAGWASAGRSAWVAGVSLAMPAGVPRWCHRVFVAAAGWPAGAGWASVGRSAWVAGSGLAMPAGVPH